jgi:tetratricopeptide (TPR) repeat protein
MRVSLSKRFTRFLIFALVLYPAFLPAAIWLSAITGTCTDEDGKPLAGAVLRFTDPANGKHFEITTNPDGRFTYIAVAPSHYRLDVLRAKQQTRTFPDIYLEWSSRPLLLDVDLRSQSVKVTRQVLVAESFGTELPPTTVPAPDKVDADIARAITEKIAVIQAYIAARDWDNALSTAKAATEIDPRRDLPWAWLAKVYCSEAQHSSSTSAITLQNCILYYEKAILIAPNPTYFNNLGVAYSSLQEWDKAAENFRAAILASPANAALYRANLGAAFLKKSEGSDKPNNIEALQSAEKEFSRAADAVPALNETYYWKGLCELRLAALEVPGFSYPMAGESFARYLQLVPNGPYASEARSLVEGLQRTRLRQSNTSAKP